MTQDIKLWTISDGRAGMANQVIGLGNAIASKLNDDQYTTSQDDLIITPTQKMTPPLFMWHQNPLAFSRLSHQGNNISRDDIRQNLPDIIIACGRHTINFARIMRRVYGTFVIQTQDPRKPIRDFDVIVPPHHDHLSGENVFAIHGAPNKITTEKISTEGRIFKHYLEEQNYKLTDESANENNTKTIISILVGGNSKAYNFTEKNLAKLISFIRSATAQKHFCAITLSRRTPQEYFDKLTNACADLINDKLIYIYDPFTPQAASQEPNPYFGLLGIANHIIVTSDSTNMVCEAASTGKPVHIFELHGGNAKFNYFHQSMVDQGITRLLHQGDMNAPLPKWSYEPLDETNKVAAKITAKFITFLHEKQSEKP